MAPTRFNQSWREYPEPRDLPEMPLKVGQGDWYLEVLASDDEHLCIGTRKSWNQSLFIVVPIVTVALFALLVAATITAFSTEDFLKLLWGIPLAGLLYLMYVAATWTGYRVTFDYRNHGIERISLFGWRCERFILDDSFEIECEVVSLDEGTRTELRVTSGDPPRPLFSISGETTQEMTGAFLVRVAVAAAKLLDLPLAAKLDPRSAPDGMMRLFDLIESPSTQRADEWYRKWGRAEPVFAFHPEWIYATVLHAAIFSGVAVFTHSLTQGLGVFCMFMLMWIATGVCFQELAGGRVNSGSAIIDAYVGTRRKVGALAGIVLFPICILGASWYCVNPGRDRGANRMDPTGIMHVSQRPNGPLHVHLDLDKLPTTETVPILLKSLEEDARPEVKTAALRGLADLDPNRPMKNGRDSKVPNDQPWPEELCRTVLQAAVPFLDSDIKDRKKAAIQIFRRYGRVGDLIHLEAVLRDSDGSVAMEAKGAAEEIRKRGR